jgi:DedD protein
MREGAKQRLVGAVVIVALAVIFVPMLFEQESLSPPPIQESIPRAPEYDPDIRSEVFLGPEDSGVGGVDDAELTESQPLPLPLPPAGDLEPAPTGEAPEEVPAGTGSETTSPPSGSPQAAARPAPRPVAAPSLPPVLEPVAPRGAADGMPSWVIQVASLATPESAGELEGRLRKNGFSAFVEKAEVNGKLYYRVRVGPELDRASAERTAAQLRERHKLDTLIKNYP